MLKRAHNYPRVILNRAEAYTTDTAYRIKLKTTRAEAFVFSFVNSLTCLTAEMEGRHYGGGVLELVPSEIERLLLPLVNAGKAELRAADQRFRSCQDEVTFLREQDSVILGEIGMSKKDQGIIFGAWLKLRHRRQRTSSATTAPEEEA